MLQNTTGDQQAVSHASAEELWHHTFHWADVVVHEESKVSLDTAAENTHNVAVVTIGAISSSVSDKDYVFPDDFQFARLASEPAQACMQYTTAGWGAHMFHEGEMMLDEMTYEYVYEGDILYPNELRTAVLPAVDAATCAESSGSSE